MPSLFVRSLVLVASLAALITPANSNPVLDWSALMMSAIRLESTGPTISTRNLAILNIATYDAVNSIVRTHQSYAFQLDAPSDASVTAAVIGAGREVMNTLYPSLAARTEELYLAQLATLSSSHSLNDGLQVGHTAAQMTLAMRSADNAATEVPYIPSAAPGSWQRTPPFYRPPLTPHWRYVAPFCIPNVESFLPKPPPALNSDEYTAAFIEVKEIGARDSNVRTAEQSLIAVFWSDFSYTAMPPGHWHEIAATICRNENVSIENSARLFALLGMAQADAAIVCWESKYHWNLWRPVTAIQRADEDGNPGTNADAEWDHFLVAPPFPAYTSGHSTFSKASAEVLTQFFGRDAIHFTATSDSVPGVTREYTSLSECADEIGMSRIYGGIHFRFDNEEGKRTGAMVANHVTRNYLLPNSSLPNVRFEGRTNGVSILRAHGHIGRTMILERSVNLVTWIPVATNIATVGGVMVGDTSADNPTRLFYRVRESQ